MQLSRGTLLGAYQVDSLLGAGGMGEVYRARDSKLGRHVAVKVLPAAVATDPERVGRFEREAKVLASLNHPHIATLHGLEHFEGRHFLVMELVEGETIADRLARGPMPVAEALVIVRQIAEALEAAHEIGVVHRDLKPANIKVTPDDRVKVLDFGLAKAFATAESGVLSGSEGPGVTNSPTLSIMGTQAGLILGTAAYMAPEQAKGLPADTRSDVFSFGAVLFEMLSGRQAFNGDTVPDILASVLARDPDWNALPNDLDPRLLSLLRRCLAKPRKQRWQAIGDVRAELDLIATQPAVAPSTVAVASPPRRRWQTALALIVVAAIASGVTVAVMRYLASPPPTNVLRFTVSLPEGQVFGNSVRQLLDISPDGSHIALGTNSGIYIRSMSELDGRLLQGTERATNATFSPDGRSIVFFSGLSNGSLQRMSIAGGAALTLTAAGQLQGMTWSPQGIFYAQGNEIFRLSPNGGTPTSVVSAAPAVLQTPRMLPDGDHLLYTSSPGLRAMDWENATANVVSLSTGERKEIAKGAADARYVSTGHLLYATGGVIFAAPFDLKTLEVTGEPVPVIEGVLRAPAVTGIAHFAVSNNGVLLYAPGTTLRNLGQRRIVIADEAGVLSSPPLPAGGYETPRISPDGKWLAFGNEDRDASGIWVYELSGTTAVRRLTFDKASSFPLWTRDSQRITYQSRSDNAGMYWQRADGSGVPEQLTKAETGVSHVPESWSPDGNVLLYSRVEGAKVTLWMLDRQTGKSSPFENVESASPLGATFSPDGRWVAYATRTMSSQSVVYVQPFPPSPVKYQISRNDDAHHPLWSPDGKRLYYIPAPGMFVYVPIETNPVFKFGAQQSVTRMFSIGNAPTEVRGNDITPDGRRFVGLALAQGEGVDRVSAPSPTLRVVINWFEDLKQRASNR